MTAKNKRIFYDDACPMCRSYTAAFVQCGILPPDGRMGFAEASSADLARMDANRARHEIPLIDTDGGETLYGMDAWFALLANRFPILTPVFRSGVPGAVLTPLYTLISYNRRVIVGCPPAPIGANGFDPAPDFSLGWRVAYLAFCFTGWLLLLGNVATTIPVLTTTIGVFAALQIIGIGLALTVLPRHCGVWDRAGSLATNGLMFGMLLAGLTQLSGGLFVATWLAFALCVLVTLQDVNRRLRPRCVTVPTPRRGRIMLPMADSCATDNTVLRCLRCQEK